MMRSKSNINDSIQSTVKRIRQDLNSENFNAALKKIHKIVERVITEPICVSIGLGSQDLDNLCLEIGQKNLNKIDRDHSVGLSNTTNPKRVAYIVTRLQNSGGHSRLILDFIRSQPCKDHIILSTELFGDTEKSFLKNPLVINSKNVTFMKAPRGNFEFRLTWLQRTLVKSGADCVYLFNHHQDSVAVAALVPELGIKGFFCHHGDHHFCLGVHLTHLTHIDFHPMGYHNCKNELEIENLYLPLTCNDKGFSSFESSVTKKIKLTTATAARSNKLEIPYYVDYFDLVPKLLKATSGRHIHIGKLSYLALRRIYSGMRKLGIDSENFIYIEWTPSVWRTLQQYNVDLYIASFPYGAGLTVIEALGAGIPVILHEHIHSRVLSGLELSYPQAFRWNDPDILLRHLSRLRPEDLSNERLLARNHYQSFHHSDILEQYFKNPDVWQHAPPPLVEDFKPRWDEWAAWIAAQVTISGLMYRFRYRVFRKIRGFVSQTLR